jgi:hypothetical protein
VESLPITGEFALTDDSAPCKTSPVEPAANERLPLRVLAANEVEATKRRAAVKVRISFIGISFQDRIKN